MRIPIPATPRWLDRWLDIVNRDAGPKLWLFQPRWIDYLGLVVTVIAIVIDGLYFHGWKYALTVDPLLTIMGLMVVMWFIKGDRD